AGLAGVAAALVLVEVVADAHDDVDFLVDRHVAVRGEVAGLPVGAGGQRDAEGLGRDAGRRVGAGAADGRGLALVLALGDGEPEVVPGVGLQAGGVDLDGVVVARDGGGLAGGRDVRERLVGGDLPAQLDLGALFGAGDVAGVRS